MTERRAVLCFSILYWSILQCINISFFFCHSICSQCQQSLKCQTKCEKDDDRGWGGGGGQPHCCCCWYCYYSIQSQAIQQQRCPWRGFSRDRRKKIKTRDTERFRGLLWIQRHFLGNTLIPPPPFRNLEWKKYTWELDLCGMQQLGF